MALAHIKSILALLKDFRKLNPRYAVILLFFALVTSAISANMLPRFFKSHLHSEQERGISSQSVLEHNKMHQYLVKPGQKLVVTLRAIPHNGNTWEVHPVVEAAGRHTPNFGEHPVMIYLSVGSAVTVVDGSTEQVLGSENDVLRPIIVTVNKEMSREYQIVHLRAFHSNHWYGFVLNFADLLPEVGRNEGSGVFKAQSQDVGTTKNTGSKTNRFDRDQYRIFY